MLVGIGILMALFWVGHAFELYSLNWILGHFFESFFIIAIILFQDQFRLALANFGTRGNLFNFLNRERPAYFEEINEIVSAVSTMSNENIGAIIAIEKSQGLANYKATGVNVDCKLNADLIYSIFESSSPLHDGAIIISGGKIASVGCFLPLSSNVELKRGMGTRHSAAIGVTENTDCVAITVSEETGDINIAVNGVFYSCASIDQLRNYMTDFLSRKKLGRKLYPIKSKGRRL